VSCMRAVYVRVCTAYVACPPVPECGTLHVRTELGCMDIASGEVGVVQRGLRFSVALDGPSRGYVLEVRVTCAWVPIICLLFFVKFC